MKIEIKISVKKETHYEFGDLLYYPKGGYKIVIVGRTIRQRIQSQMWYGIREGGMSISIVNERQLRECEYLGKSKGFETLFEVKDEQ